MTTRDELKSALAGIQRQAVRAETADQKILDAARQRRDQVTERLAELQGQALTDPEAATQYQVLLSERGQLDTVIGQG